MPVSKLCKYCSNVFYCKPSHESRTTYCSKKCMAEDYKTRLKGKSNPHYFNASNKVCAICNKNYSSYDPKSKYCCVVCYGLARIKPKIIKEKVIKIKKVCIKKPKKKRLEKKCLQCLKGFMYPPSDSHRKYCSYQCHLDSGGAFRAGMEAAKMARKYGAKKDANHHDVVNVLLKMGIPFYDLSAAGCGIPDGIAWVKERWEFIEIKNPKTGYGRRGLNPIQKKWISQWQGGGVYILKTVDDAIKFAKGELEGLTYIEGSVKRKKPVSAKIDASGGEVS